MSIKNAFFNMKHVPLPWLFIWRSLIIMSCYSHSVHCLTMFARGPAIALTFSFVVVVVFFRCCIFSLSHMQENCDAWFISMWVNTNCLWREKMEATRRKKNEYSTWKLWRMKRIDGGKCDVDAKRHLKIWGKSQPIKMFVCVCTFEVYSNRNRLERVRLKHWMKFYGNILYKLFKVCFSLAYTR